MLVLFVFGKFFILNWQIRDRGSVYTCVNNIRREAKSAYGHHSDSNVRHTHIKDIIECRHL